MEKIRVQFKRGESLRFLSHLDQQRLFGRALRRAKIPIAFSQGFNPHPIISFANAMSVGMTSDCEYVDIGLDVEDLNEGDMSRIKKKLIKAMPDGIKISDVQLLPKDAKSLTRMITSADYDVICLGLNVSNFDDFQQSLEEFNQKKEIIMQKKNKRGKLQDKDVRPNFDHLTTEKSGKNVIFHVKILPISGSLIRPEALVKIFLNNINYYDKSLQIVTHRNNIELES